MESVVFQETESLLHSDQNAVDPEIPSKANESRNRKPSLETALMEKILDTPKQTAAPKKSYLHAFFTEWTEDGVGMTLGLFAFACTVIFSNSGVNFGKAYATSSQWPLGVCGISFALIIISHKMLKKPLALEPYFIIILISVVARSIGNYKAMTDIGLGASLWGIILGILVRSVGGIVLPKGVFSGEFFVKVGVAMMAMDFTSVVDVGLPGLMVAWFDTLFILTVGTYLAMWYFKFDIMEALVIAGGTSICGSSAATAISASIRPPKYEDPIVKSIIAIMGVFNAPQMPILPLAKIILNVNPDVVGAWIGGSIDSTGQVVASAAIGGDDVLEAAVIIKMAQNILIGPLCLAMTGYFQGSFDPMILVNRFPLFVVGFLLTSAITTTVLSSNGANFATENLIIDNTWWVSEWITLLGFSCIGLEIDISKYFTSDSQHKRVLYAYILIQCIDLTTTFAWSYLMFHNSNINQDD